MADPQQPDEKEEKERLSNTKEPIELIPEDVLEYHPVVTESLELLTDPDMGVILGRSASFHDKYRSSGLGMIGAVSEASDDPLVSLLGTPVWLDLVSPHVLFVAGKRGSGKSYTLGIIAEELALAMERREIEVAAVLIDTVDVFRQMVEPNTGQSGILKDWSLEARGFPLAVYIPKRSYVGLPDEVKKRSRLLPLSISPSELSGAEWGYVLEKDGQLSTTMDNLIGDILHSLKKGYSREDGNRVLAKSDFSIRDMIECIDTNPTFIDLYKPATRTALIQRLRKADRLGVFNPGGTSAQDLAIPGQISVVDVAPLGSDAEAVLAILTNILCRQVLTYRMAWTDEGTSAREELPPTWLVIDEAHTLVPRSGTTPAKDAIISYAKLGRRFGCSLVLCTQQPSAVSDDAISQADIILSHSLSHDGDIKALQQRAPAVMPEAFRDKVFISSLPRGVALAFDQTTENRRGFLVQIRPRLSKHGGTDRLSSLFEAAKLMPPEALELDESEEAEPSSEGASLSSEDEEVLTDLPNVPKPPVKMSREDWEALDEWIREYVKVLFSRQEQGYSITDEPAPRQSPTEEPPQTEGSEVPIPDISVSESGIDMSNVKTRVFGDVSRSLLEKAMTRKVLYSTVSHRFLFPSESVERDVIGLCVDGSSPQSVVKKAIVALLASGMKFDSVKEQDGLSFLFFTGKAARASIAGGTSEGRTCVPIVVTCDDRKSLASMVNSIRMYAR
jgi:hypothetical protein